jgi:hemolysin D
MSGALRIRLLAWRDLLRHYGAVFAQAWRQRDLMVLDRYRVEEAQFLPAALSLRETPLSPVPRITAWLLIGFCAGALVWAFVGHIDIVVMAQGRTVPGARTKLIQPLESAKVREIRVAEGQRVKRAQVLVVLDTVGAEADTARAHEDRVAAGLQRARAMALLASVDGARVPVLAQVPGATPQQMAAAQAHAQAQAQELASKLARLDAEIARRIAEEVSVAAAITRVQDALPSAREQASDYQQLLLQEQVSKHATLDKVQRVLDLEGELAQQRAKRNESRAALAEGRAQRVALQTETRRTWLDALADATQRLSAYEQEWVKAKARSALAELTAPVDGTVQQLAIHTVGGVVTAAQTLMVLVPDGEELVVEAVLENKDVGFVHAGQEAQVKVDAFSYTKYGTVPGQVISVSQDAVNDEKRGLVYTAQIALYQSTLLVEGKQVRLSPGLSTTVEIKTGKRRLIEYFLSPLLQYQQESLRER